MKSFEPGFLENVPVTQNILRTVRLLGEFRGREELFQQQTLQVLETLKQVAVIQSTESSNRIEGITASAERVRELVGKRVKPRDRSEQQIAGYRDVLNTIHANHANIPFTNGVILQFHRDLYRYAETSGGKWKSTDNKIEESRPNGTRVIRFDPVSAFATPQAMELLDQTFRSFWETGLIEKLILISAYQLDFLCIHPFLDGNGRMVRLLTLLLLYHAGFGVGRYVSLERVVEQSKETYYDSLYASSQGWHEGKHQLLPWIEFSLGILVAAYKEFEQRVGALTTARGAKTEMVLEAVRHRRGDFAAREIQDLCPSVGIDLIRRILQEEKAAGRLEPTGRGPRARWRKK